MGNRPALALRARGFLFLAVLGISAGPASAHDLWLLVGRYHLSPFETTRAFVNSGDTFPESLSLVGEHRLTSVSLRSGVTRTTIDDFRVDQKSLSFDVSVRESGSYVIALGTEPRRVRLRAREFQEYLEENRLDHVTKLREELGESEEPALERYAKWAKAFVDVGAYEESEDEAVWAEPAGQAIEIVPARNPNRLEPGESLEVRVLFLEEPLAAAFVSGGRAGGLPGEVSAVTDESGLASFELREPGRWHLRVVHMTRVEDDPGVQWESYWATITFEIEEVP